MVRTHNSKSSFCPPPHYTSFVTACMPTWIRSVVAVVSLVPQPCDATQPGQGAFFGIPALSMYTSVHYSTQEACRGIPRDLNHNTEVPLPLPLHLGE